MDQLAATCDMAHDWGAARPVPQLKQHLTAGITSYLGLDGSFKGGPEEFFMKRISTDTRFAACDVSVFPVPFKNLTTYPTANYFCIPRDVAEARNAAGDTILSTPYLDFLNNFFGTYRPSTRVVVDPSKGAGIVFVEDAQSLADWAHDAGATIEDKPPRGVAGPAQLLDSATDASSWFRNVPSDGNEPAGIGKWKVEILDGGDPATYVFDGGFEFRSTKQVRLTAGDAVIDFPVGMKTGPSIRTLSALMCAYLKKQVVGTTNIRNYMVELLQYVPPDKKSGKTGEKRPLRANEMKNVNFLGETFTRLFAGGKHEFNVKLIAFLKYVGDKGQNIYAGNIGATAGTTGDRLSAISFVMYGNTPAIYRDGKGNHVFIFPPALREASAPVSVPDPTNAKYQFLVSVYTRVGETLQFAGRIARMSGGSNEETKRELRDFFIARGKELLSRVSGKLLNTGATGDDIQNFLLKLSDDEWAALKGLTEECPVFRLLRTNFVTFTDEDFIPGDIDEFVEGERTGTTDPEVPIETHGGDDAAEFIDSNLDEEAIAEYKKNNYADVPAAGVDLECWNSIVNILTIPPGTPSNGSRGAQSQSQVDTLPYSAERIDHDSDSGSAGLTYGSPMFPAPSSESEGSMAPPPLKRQKTGDIGGRLRITIRRRSGRTTKKNRKRRLIEVHI